MKTLFVSLALMLVLNACEISVKDGKVPPNYISAAREYVGTYVGDFDNRHGSVVLALRDDGFLQVTTPGFEGGDIYDVGCGSVIGPLLFIEGTAAKGQNQPSALGGIILGYHHHALECVSGDQIDFNFSKDKQGRTELDASLFLFYASGGMAYTLYGEFIKQTP